MAFKEIEVGLWIPEKEEDSVQGVLLKSEPNVGANNSMMYTLDVDGKPIGVWGATILDPKMTAVKVGEVVKITYKGLGEAKGGHNPPKIFKVEVDRD